MYWNFIIIIYLLLKKCIGIKKLHCVIHSLVFLVSILLFTYVLNLLISEEKFYFFLLDIFFIQCMKNRI